MAFRFDMQGKTSQQQIIVAKRNAENVRIRQESNKNAASKSLISSVVPNFLVLTLGSDICPMQSRTINQTECMVCKYNKSSTKSLEESEITCSYLASQQKVDD